MGDGGERIFNYQLFFMDSVIYTLDINGILPEEENANRLRLLSHFFCITLVIKSAILVYFLK